MMNLQETVSFLQNSGFAITIPNEYKYSYNSYYFSRYIDNLLYSALSLHLNIPYHSAACIWYYINKNKLLYNSIAELQKYITYKYHFIYEKYIITLFTYNDLYIWNLSNTNTIDDLLNRKTKFYIFQESDIFDKLHIVLVDSIYETVYINIENSYIYEFSYTALYNQAVVQIQNNKIHSWDKPAIYGPNHNEWYVYDEHIGSYVDKNKFISCLKEEHPLYYNLMLKEQSQNMFD